MKQDDIRRYLEGLANPDIAQQTQRFCKTGKGEYAEGDRFLGIRVPVLRQAVKTFRAVPFEHSNGLLISPYHEIRLFSLLHMVHCFNKGDESLRSEIYHYYLSHTQYINNWDLVDSSAHLIVGPYLMDKNRDILKQLSLSELIWDRRIAMMSCFHFIRANQFEDALEIALSLLSDEEDLIHKVVGWMLREVGNRDKQQELAFVNQYYQQMPRTMLRYAIEKFPEAQRQAYLTGAV